MKTTKKQSGAKPIVTKGKRVSLRCPLTIDRTEVDYLTDTASLKVEITLENTGGGGLTSNTIESAVLVLRLYDGKGDTILCGEKEYYAKSLRFGKDGLWEGEQINFNLTPNCSAGDRVANVELYVSRVIYTDSTAADFMRGDFFDLPGEGVLLAKKFKKNTNQAVELLGEGATYLPEVLTDIVWRCTCGEFSESEICPKCGRNKNDVFAALDTLLLPLVKIEKAQSTEVVAPALQEDQSPADGKTAEYSISPQIIAAKAALDRDENGGDGSSDHPSAAQDDTAAESNQNSRSKSILLASISAASVILLVLILLLVLRLCSPQDTAAETTTTGEPTVTEPSAEDAAEQIVRTYLKANQFKNALGYAMQNNMGDELINEIYNQAIAYYVEIGQLESALEYAREQGNTEKANQLLSDIFEEKLSAKDYVGAMQTAEELPEDIKEDAKKRASEGYVKSLVSEGKYTEAMAAADEYQTATTSKQIALLAISNYQGKNDFETAMQYAENAGLTDQIPLIAKNAVSYYMEQSNLPLAMSYLKLAEDEEATQSVYVKLSDVQIRQYLPTFFSYLDFSKKQAVHASPISAQPQAMVAVDQMGNVFLGEEMIYTATGSKKVVSVSACDTAVVALFSDGSVSILAGENSYYDQNDLKSWKKIVAISAGNYHLLALTEDGKVLAAGKNDDGQCNTADLSNAVMVSAGAHHSLILLSDGSVVALGKDLNGICSTGDWTDIVAVSAGVLHSIGIKSDGTAVALGNCDVSGWTNVLAVVSGGTSAVAITADHKVFYSASGKPSDSMVGYENVLWVSVRQNFVCVLKFDSTLTGIGLTGMPPAGIAIYSDLLGLQSSAE